LIPIAEVLRECWEMREKSYTHGDILTVSGMVYLRAGLLDVLIPIFDTHLIF
jgi:hypothetical protein